MSIRISVGIDYCPISLHFITMIPKLQIFPHTCLFTFFGNNYNIGELTSTTSKERMTTNIIFAGTTPINEWKFHIPVSFVFTCPITQCYRQRRTWTVSLLATIWRFVDCQRITTICNQIKSIKIKYGKLTPDSSCPYDQWVMVKRQKTIILCFQCGLIFTKHFKQKNSVINVSAITAVTKPSMKPRSHALLSIPFPTYAIVGKGMDNKVSFGKTMMRVLELLQLAKRHISGWSNIEQWRKWRNRAYSLLGY